MRPQAQDNFAINTEPVDPDGEEMHSYYELRNGYYLYAHLGAKDKKIWIRDFAEKVGLSVDFLGEW